MNTSFQGKLYVVFQIPDELQNIYLVEKGLIKITNSLECIIQTIYKKKKNALHIKMCRPPRAYKISGLRIDLSLDILIEFNVVPCVSMLVKSHSLEKPSSDLSATTAFTSWYHVHIEPLRLSALNAPKLKIDTH